jgi:hypothetical protein
MMAGLNAAELLELALSRMAGAGAVWISLAGLFGIGCGAIPGAGMFINASAGSRLADQSA